MLVADPNLEGIPRTAYYSEFILHEAVLVNDSPLMSSLFTG